MRRALSPAPRRVLLTADAVGGVWSYALDLAGEYRARGIDVVLAVLGPPPSEVQRTAAEAVAGLDCRETGLPLEWLAGSPAEVEDAAAALADLVRDAAPDVVHLNHPALTAGAAFARPLVATLHSCTATWWDAVRGSAPLPADFRWRLELTRRGLARADLRLAPSRAFAHAAGARYPGLDFEVVHNGRPAPAAGAGEPRAGVVTSGRLWDEGKNVEALERVAHRVDGGIRAAGPVEGPGGARVRLEAVEPLGVLGPEAVRTLLARSEVYVSTARFEPFGLGVLEAAQAGCALVLAGMPTFRELWEGAALFVDAADADALVGAVAEARANASTLGAAAQERARRFTVERMAEATIAAYAAAGRRATGVAA